MADNERLDQSGSNENKEETGEFSVECVVIVKKAEATDIRTVSPQLS